MKQITAKYDSRQPCPRCGCAIKAGQKINWSRDARSTHVGCVKAKTDAHTGRAIEVGQSYVTLYAGTPLECYLVVAAGTSNSEVAS